MAVEVKTSRFEDLISYDIILTKGDDAVLALPLYDGDGNTPYVPQSGDVIKIQVRKSRITTNALTPSIIFDGSVSVVDNVPCWSISHSDSNINCDLYYWDMQITVDGKNYTPYQGTLKIVPEVTQ